MVGIFSEYHRNAAEKPSKILSKCHRNTAEKPSEYFRNIIKILLKYY